jgi:hypothetical protein
MTLTTFAMEKEGIKRMEAKSLSAAEHNPLDFINDFLPGTFPGRVIHMEHTKSEYSLRGVLHGRIAFDKHGTEDIEMQISDLHQDIDIFTLFATCVKERLVHLEARKRKHLSMLVQNIYKGV